MLPVVPMTFVLEVMFVVLVGYVLPPSKEVTEQIAKPVSNVVLAFFATQTLNARPQIPLLKLPVKDH
jgi:hypothetical protein